MFRVFVMSYYDRKIRQSIPHLGFLKILHVLNRVITYKWLHETTETVGDIKHHHDAHSDNSLLLASQPYSLVVFVPVLFKLFQHKLS